ncbi:hypothetical protein G7Y79_00003g012200 [Physcia stellaris]|nr:hypothetical protein G7Y79_00003g012200 [Physcia stellaris]
MLAKNFNAIIVAALFPLTLILLFQPPIPFAHAFPPRPISPSLLFYLYNATHHPHHLLLPVPNHEHCTRITTPGTPGLEPTNCELISDRTCLRISLTRPSLVHNKWIWDEMPGCALGYYFPSNAYIPTREECSYAAEKLIEECILDSRFNAGSLNVGTERGDPASPQRFALRTRLHYAATLGVYDVVQDLQSSFWSLHGPVMSTLGKLSAALISGTNENNLVSVSVNLDFSLIQLEAPKEFLSLGDTLSTKRRKTAEEGSLHRTARRLGALFEGIVPSTPALIKSYGKRVSEISASPQVNPKGSVADGMFANHVGIVGTSIWSAATSRAAAISVHLLACLIARTLSPAEVTSMLVEVVEERKAEIKAAIDDSQIRGVADYMASHLGRNWPTGMLLLVLGFLALTRSNVTNKYNSNSLRRMSASMISLEKLINGMPQSISKGAVLLGLSAWHIFPDLNIVGQKNTTVLFRDALVAPGGIITIGLQNINEDDDSGVRWSLDLSYLKHYGDPVAVSVSSAADGTRLSADELHIIAFGSPLEAWGTIGDDPIVVARTISRIWDLIQNSVLTKKRKRDQALTTGSNDPRTQWLLPLVNAAKLVLDAVDGTSEPTVLLLLNLGRRRGPLL